MKRKIKKDEPKSKFKEPVFIEDVPEYNKIKKSVKKLRRKNRKEWSW
jgi:hypothetical protein